MKLNAISYIAARNTNGYLDHKIQTMHRQILVTVLFLLGLSMQSYSQDLSVRGNVTVNAISDFESGFVGGGLGVEGTVGRHWSVGTDVSWAKRENLKVFNFNPSIRFYFNRGLRGLFLGVGANVLNLKSEVGPIGYPIEISRGQEVLIGGPEASLGLQTRIDNRITMGFKAGLSAFTDIDLDETVGFNMNFTVGVLLF